MQLTFAFKNIKFIFLKEMRETLRDRRTLMITVLLPVLLYPVLILGLSQLIFLQIGKIEQKKSRIAWCGVCPELGKKVAQDPRFEMVEVPDVTGIKNMIVRKEVEAGVEITERFEELVREMQDRPRPRLILHYSETNEVSQAAVKKLAPVLETFFYETLKMRIETKGHSESLLHPFHMVLKNVARAEEEGGFHFGRILAFLLALMAVSFTLYPAIDMVAGEKERGTMETLLICPAHRLEIILGKYLAVFTIAMVGSILNLTSMGLTFGYFASLANEASLSKMSRSLQDSTAKGSGLQEIVKEAESTLWGHSGRITGAFFTGPTDLFSVDEGGNAFYWDLQKEQKERTKIAPPVCFAFSPKRNCAVWGTRDGEVWLARPGEKKIEKIGRMEGPVVSVCFAPHGGKVAAVNAKREVYFWEETDFLQKGPVFSCPEQAGPMSFSPRGNYLVVRSSFLSFLDPKTGELLKTVPGDASCVRFSPDERYLLLGTREGEWRLWDIAGEKVVWSEKSETAWPMQMVFSDDGQTIVSSDSEGNLGLWRLLDEKLQPIRKLPGHEGAVGVLDIWPDNGTCLSGGDDGLVKVWKYATPRLKFSLSFFSVLMILVTLVPLTGLFAAVSLALSTFAKSYKEAQYYLTPIIIVVMPLVMISFIPAITLDTGRCFIPVAGVVLLYKDLFLGQVQWAHLLSVFGATFLYASLALWWAVVLFRKESVLFRH